MSDRMCWVVSARIEKLCVWSHLLLTDYIGVGGYSVLHISTINLLTACLMYRCLFSGGPNEIATTRNISIRQNHTKSLSTI